MGVIAVAAVLVIALALIEIPVARRIRRWKRRREMRHASHARVDLNGE